MILRVNVKPELLRWARERASIKPDALVKRFPRYREWESGTKQPTLKQLEKLAKVTRAPIGSFFLSQPLEERVPIPDLRTIGDTPIGRPSVDLLDTVYLSQQRQDWYRDFARMEGEDPLPFVGSATQAPAVESIAESMRSALDFDLDERRALPTWTEALRRFIEQADDLAPLVFINGADSKAAQMFTLAHELAHIWLGESALSDVEPISAPSHAVEAWCNRTAAELLVPLASLREEFRGTEDLSNEINRLARRYKVSTVVVLRRVFDIGALDRDALAAACRREVNRLGAMPARSGGSFHPTLKARVGKRFGHALVTSTLGGRTSFSESFRLLGIRKTSTFRGFAASLELGW